MSRAQNQGESVYNLQLWTTRTTVFIRLENVRWGLTNSSRCLTVVNYDFAVAPSPSPSSSGGRGVGEASNLINQAIIRLSPLTRFTPAGFLLFAAKEDSYDKTRLRQDARSDPGGASGSRQRRGFDAGLHESSGPGGDSPP